MALFTHVPYTAKPMRSFGKIHSTHNLDIYAKFCSNKRGNDVEENYAVFIVDNIEITRGYSKCTIDNFIGFCTGIQYFWSPSFKTSEREIEISVLKKGSIRVYNSSPISKEGKIFVITSLVLGETPDHIHIGSIFQGDIPKGITVLDISDNCKIVKPATNAGEFVTIDVNI